MHCRPTYREREGEKEEEIGERERKIEKERDREIRGSLFSFFSDFAVDRGEELRIEEEDRIVWIGGEEEGADVW